MKNSYLILICLLCFCDAVYSQYSLRWQKHDSAMFNYPVLQIDNFQNLYVSSNVYNQATDYDYLTIKYDSSGSVLWKRSLDCKNSSKDNVNSNFIDHLSNYYITGYFKAPGENYDIMTIKYSANGDSLWSVIYNGQDNRDDFSYAIFVDDSLNCYITGTSVSNFTYFDYVTIKYNSMGIQQWVRKYNDPENSWDIASSILVDSKGNVYVSGASNSTPTNGDILTIKYDRNGTQKWSKFYSTPYNDDSPILKMDDKENIYLTGSSGRAYGLDIVTLKYDTAGNQMWFDVFHSATIGWARIRNNIIDRFGNCYVGGIIDSAANNDYDFTLIKYDTSGVRKWVKNYGGAAGRL
ncbi:MAG: SBBP repeat-containing protein [Ignavibacteria bacterium]|nr:SBBP repeat-containing protein [Ignavibacteria bacterium]